MSRPSRMHYRWLSAVVAVFALVLLSFGSAAGASAGDPMPVASATATPSTSSEPAVTQVAPTPSAPATTTKSSESAPVTSAPTPVVTKVSRSSKVSKAAPAVDNGTAQITWHDGTCTVDVTNGRLTPARAQSAQLDGDYKVVPGTYKTDVVLPSATFTRGGLTPGLWDVAVSWSDGADSVEEMHTFVSCSPPPPADADNDGVPDGTDKCPGTPAGEPVDANGCSSSQLDNDKDGVTNDKDKCPNTPAGTPVDANGCPVVTPPTCVQPSVDTLGYVYARTVLTVTVKNGKSLCEDFTFDVARWSYDSPPNSFPQTFADKGVATLKANKPGATATATVSNGCGQFDAYVGSGPSAGDKLTGPNQGYNEVFIDSKASGNGPPYTADDATTCVAPTDNGTATVTWGCNFVTVHNGRQQTAKVTTAKLDKTLHVVPGSEKTVSLAAGKDYTRSGLSKGTWDALVSYPNGTVVEKMHNIKGKGCGTQPPSTTPPVTHPHHHKPAPTTNTTVAGSRTVSEYSDTGYIVPASAETTNPFVWVFGGLFGLSSVMLLRRRFLARR